MFALRTQQASLPRMRRQQRFGTRPMLSVWVAVAFQARGFHHQGMPLSLRTLMTVLTHNHRDSFGPSRALPTTFSGQSFQRCLREVGIAVRLERSGVTQHDASHSQLSTDATSAVLMSTTSTMSMSRSTMDSLGLSELIEQDNPTDDGADGKGAPEQPVQPPSGPTLLTSASHVQMDRASEDLLLAAAANGHIPLRNAFRLLIKARGGGEGAQGAAASASRFNISEASFVWLMQSVCRDLLRTMSLSVQEHGRAEVATRIQPHSVRKWHWANIEGGYLLAQQLVSAHESIGCCDSASWQLSSWRATLQFAALVADVDLTTKCLEFLTSTNALRPSDAMTAAVSFARCKRVDLCDSAVRLAREPSRSATDQAPPADISLQELALQEVIVLAHVLPANAAQLHDVVSRLAQLIVETDVGTYASLTDLVGNACGALLAKAAECTFDASAPRPQPDEQQPPDDNDVGAAKLSLDPLSLVESLLRSLLEGASEGCLRHPLLLEGLLAVLAQAPAPQPSRVASLTANILQRSKRRELSVPAIVDVCLAEQTAHASLDQLDVATRTGLGALSSAVDAVAVRLFLTQSHPALFFSALALGEVHCSRHNDTTFATERHYSVLVMGVVALLETLEPSLAQILEAADECIRRAPKDSGVMLSPPTAVALQRLRCLLWTSTSGTDNDAAVALTSTSLDALMARCTVGTKLLWGPKVPEVTDDDVVGSLALSNGEKRVLTVVDDALFSWVAEACSGSTVGAGWAHWQHVVGVLDSVARAAARVCTEGRKVVLLSDQADVLYHAFGVLRARSPVLPPSTTEALSSAEERLKQLPLCTVAASARIRMLQSQESPHVQVLAHKTPQNVHALPEKEGSGVFVVPLRDPTVPPDPFEATLDRLNREGTVLQRGSTDSRPQPLWAASGATQQALLASDLGMVVC